MKTPTLLKLTSVLAFVQFCAHTTLFLTYAPAHGAEEVDVVRTMKSHFFLFGGSPHSYWEFYFGYGLFSAVNCLIEAVLFWQLAAIAKTNPTLIRPVAGLFLLANVGYAILVRVYFFPLPGYFDIAIAVLLGAVLVTASSRGAAAVREAARA
jgi:hypothetical protein